MAVTSLELAKVAAVAADDKKATDISLIDLTGLSDVCDYFLICTAANRPPTVARSRWPLRVVPGPTGCSSTMVRW